MKKLFLLLAVLLLTAAAGWAQTQVATLNHQGNIRVFYGPDAFVNAVNAAVDDDVINLSAGYFNTTTIDKRLNIKGAGMLVDNNEDRSSTVINRIYFLPISSGSVIEGIYSAIAVERGNVSNCVFRRCILSSASSEFSNCQFHACALDSHGDLPKSSIFLNSCLNLIPRDSGFFQNCYIHWNAHGGDPDSYYYLPDESTYINCITNGWVKNYSSTWFQHRNNVYLTDGSWQSPFRYLVNNYVATSDIFNWSSVDSSHLGILYNWFVDGFDFSLTDEAASQYVGTDGTQVGIYGGNMPFTPVVSNPRIVKCEVDSETSPEGKLNVNIEVKEGR